MKYLLFISLLITSSAFCQTINLKKVIDANIDSDIESLNTVSQSSSWKNVYPSDFKIPKGFKNYELIHQIIDYDQVAYQSCNGAVWDKNRIKGFINRWGLDTTGCSPLFINSFIHGVIGKYNGQESYIIDENNNLDLTDEEIITISDSINQTHKIVFERFISNKTVLDTVTINVLTPKLDKNGALKGLNFKYCEYRVGNFIIDNEMVEIKLYPGRWYLYHKEPKIAISSPEGNQALSVNQYFKHKDSYYQILNIDKKGYTFTIKEHSTEETPNSNQVGYFVPDFKISDSLQLSDLKGSYVYLYFWNIDCGACEFGLPTKYKKLNQEKYKDLEVVLISVAKPTATEKFLDENNISWTNVKTVGNSQIFNDFDVKRYPSQYLIDDAGIIIEKGSFIDIEKYFKE